jgi:hypothetical protein
MTTVLNSVSGDEDDSLLIDEFCQELIGPVSDTVEAKDLADTLASIEPLSQDEMAVRIFILQNVYSVLINEQHDPPAGAGSNRGLYSHAIPPCWVACRLRLLKWTL